MTQLEDEIRELHRQLTDAEQPPTGVSIAEALRRGRVLRRRRRFSAVAAPVVAAAAVAGIALAVPSPTHDNRVAPARPPIPNPAPQPGQFDPLTVNMSIGWLPPGEAALTGDTGDLNGSLTVYQERNLNLNSYTSRDANTRWRLSDYSQTICTFDGRHHRLLCNGQSILSGAAPDINRHRAFWESGYGPQHSALVWEYAPGYWAELVSVGLHQSDQTLLRIARGVAFGGSASQPVKFAVQLTGVPSSWRIGSTEVMRTSGSWLAENSVVTTGTKVLWADASWPTNGLPEISTYVGGAGVSASAVLSQVSCSQLLGYPAQSTIRINGYQVDTSAIGPPPILQQQATHGRLQSAGHLELPGPPVNMLCAPHADGLLVYEMLQGAHVQVSLTTLFQHMRLLGPKPSAWTTHPIG
jgi:hypothetical protein